MADCGTDYRTCTGSQHGADASSFLAGGKRLPRASGNQEEDGQCQSNCGNYSFRHIGLPPCHLLLGLLLLPELLDLLTLLIQLLLL